MGENGEIRREFFKKGVVASLGVVAGGSAGEAV